MVLDGPLSPSGLNNLSSVTCYAIALFAPVLQRHPVVRDAYPLLFFTIPYATLQCLSPGISHDHHR